MKTGNALTKEEIRQLQEYINPYGPANKPVWCTFVYDKLVKMKIRTMDMNDTTIPDWAEAFLNRNCIEWFVTAAADGPLSEHFRKCPGLMVPYVFFEIDGPVSVRFDGPLWQGINVINALSLMGEQS